MENGELLGEARYKTKVPAPFQTNQIIILTTPKRSNNSFFKHFLPTNSFIRYQHTRFVQLNYTMQTFTTFLAAFAAGTAFAAPTSYQNKGVDHVVKVRMIDRSRSS
jgi:hypothetical protein